MKYQTFKKPPVGIVTISILHFLAALSFIAMGIMMLIETIRGNYYTLSLGVLILLICLMFIAVFGIFGVGLFLLKGNKLAYIGSSMIFAVFTMGTIARIFIGQLTLARIFLAVPSLAILIYFLFSKKVKKFFSYSIF